MKERVKVRLPKQLREIVEEAEIDTLEWVKQAITLGLLVETGNVFRKIGDEYMILNMRDINPYPTASRVKSVESYKVVDIAPEITAEIEKTSPFGTREWVNRAISLRLMAKNLGLLVREGDEFVQISFEKE